MSWPRYGCGFPRGSRVGSRGGREGFEVLRETAREKAGPRYSRGRDPAVLPFPSPPKITARVSIIDATDPAPA
jgi:hypothetical protein